MGGSNPGITPRGSRQAEQATQLLKTRDVRAVYTSPLRRARDTATVIANHLGVELSVDDRLQERTNWDGGAALTLDEFLAEWRPSNDDRDYGPPFGDSSRDAAARFREFLHDLPTAHPPDVTVAVVSHGGVTTDLLRDLVGDDELGAMAPGIIQWGVPGCALTTLSLDGDVIAITAVASIEHVALHDRTGHER